MKKNGHQVAIIAPGDSVLFKKAKQNGLMVYPMSFKSLAGIGEYGRIKQIFAGEQPFVVNAHGKGDAKLALKAAQTMGVPCRIMSRHNGKRVKSTWPNKKIYKTLCHYIFTTSKDSAKHLKQTFSLSDMQIFSIPDGIIMPDATAPPNETPQTAARQKLANSLGLETDARFIGIFGKTARQSKQQLYKIADQLSRHFPSHHLVIAGIPENQNTMDKRFISLAHIPALPEGQDAFYQALDCCLYFPNSQNFYQGVPWEVIRAMACFCPVIGPDAPGIRDILIDNKTGRVFDPRQSESLPKIINWVLNTPQTIQTLVREAQSRVEKHYTMDAMGRDILRIYRLRQIKIDRKFQMSS
ncbi:glycosyltransferase [Desulfobacter hydrogenophilus]|uniref:Glycosyltransferase n=2 Tax=Desulfobacter hydrogenophilus TaxID=2291 RepID=A0A328F840_9BACT|nr:glycosyltransferase [Desulfobacter hydrogenophilus]QBH15688.1 glycosyltransferase [Desulfobacter hydrogenophilus]RAM00808.1 glycosyltransferase [Desulfobacter hydrogenophilus]